MLGKEKIEDMIIKKYKITTLPIFLVILIVYILNVNNHYKLFLDRYERLQTDIKYYKKNYQIFERFTKKVFKNANFIGRKFPIFDKHLTGDGHRIVVIKCNSSEELAFNNIVRIINKIKKEKPDINIISLNNLAINTKIINASNKEQFLIDPHMIVLINDQNNILCAFSIDGTESVEEVQLISEFMLEIIPKQY
jgi:hypothetical protein